MTRRGWPAFAALGLASLALAAPPPALVNYQGVLRDASNRPVDGQIGMVFRFYDAETGGNEILADHHTSDTLLVTVASGLFSVALGSGDVQDGAAILPNDPYLGLAPVFRDFATVFMEVEVRGELLAPRVRIVSAAFAINADQLDGRHAAEFVDTSASAQTKSGALRVQQDLTVDGAVRFPGGGAAAGRVLTSDAQGKASWQELPGASPGVAPLGPLLAEAGAALPAVTPQPLPCGESGTTTAQLQVGGGPLGLVTGLAGEERISRPFVFRVVLQRSDALEPAELIGAIGRLIISRPGRETVLSGLVTLAQLASYAGEQFTYVVTLEPGLTLLDRTTDYAVYENQSAPEIAREMIDAAGIPNDLQLAGTYEPLAMEVRYGESGLDFLGRLLEREGISYWFREAGGRDRLALTDDNGAFPALPAGYWYYGHFAGPTDGREYVTSYRAGDRLFTRRATVRGYDFKRPALDLTGTFDLGAGIGESYRFHAGLDSTGSATWRARIAAEREEARRLAGAGTSNAPDLRAGFQLEIRDRTPSGFGGTYVLVSVSHLLTRDAVTGCYFDANEFTTVPAVTPYRPPLDAPMPQVRGPITGTVTGPAGQTTYKDPYDRVKVLFHWDRVSAPDQYSSGWVRVLTPAGGTHTGVHYVPQVGDEVLIGFLQGDPAQPVVLGSLFNGNHMPPP